MTGRQPNKFSLTSMRPSKSSGNRWAIISTAIFAVVCFALVNLIYSLGGLGTYVTESDAKVDGTGQVLQCNRNPGDLWLTWDCSIRITPNDGAPAGTTTLSNSAVTPDDIGGPLRMADTSETRSANIGAGWRKAEVTGYPLLPAALAIVVGGAGLSSALASLVGLVVAVPESRRRDDRPRNRLWAALLRSDTRAQKFRRIAVQVVAYLFFFYLALVWYSLHIEERQSGGPIEGVARVQSCERMPEMFWLGWECTVSIRPERGEPETISSAFSRFTPDEAGADIPVTYTERRGRAADQWEHAEAQSRNLWAIPPFAILIGAPITLSVLLYLGRPDRKQPVSPQRSPGQFGI